MCGRKGSKCEKKGGMCFRKKDAPGNAEPLGRNLCRGRCRCYKIPETITTETSRKFRINSTKWEMKCKTSQTLDLV